MEGVEGGGRGTRKTFSNLLQDVTSGSGFPTATSSSLLLSSRLLISRVNVGNISELKWLFVFVDTLSVAIPYLLFRFDMSNLDLMPIYWMTSFVGTLAQHIFLEDAVRDCASLPIVTGLKLCLVRQSSLCHIHR
jgi:hypothetical protein